MIRQLRDALAQFLHWKTDQIDNLDALRGIRNILQKMLIDGLPLQGVADDCNSPEVRHHRACCDHRVLGSQFDDAARHVGHGLQRGNGGLVDHTEDDRYAWPQVRTPPQRALQRAFRPPLSTTLPATRVPARIPRLCVAVV